MGSDISRQIDVPVSIYLILLNFYLSALLLDRHVLRPVQATNTISTIPKLKPYPYEPPEASCSLVLVVLAPNTKTSQSGKFCCGPSHIGKVNLLTDINCRVLK
jgi:hypothetical protein